MQLAKVVIASTGAGITKMQLAKVVIASVLIFAARSEGLPEGKCCMKKFTLDVRLIQVFSNNITCL